MHCSTQEPICDWSSERSKDYANCSEPGSEANQQLEKQDLDLQVDDSRRKSNNLVSLGRFIVFPEYGTNLSHAPIIAMPHHRSIPENPVKPHTYDESRTDVVFDESVKVTCDSAAFTTTNHDAHGWPVNCQVLISDERFCDIPDEALARTTASDDFELDPFKTDFHLWSLK